MDSALDLIYTEDKIVSKVPSGRWLCIKSNFKQSKDNLLETYLPDYSQSQLVAMFENLKTTGVRDGHGGRRIKGRGKLYFAKERGERPTYDKEVNNGWVSFHSHPGHTVMAGFSQVPKKEQDSQKKIGATVLTSNPRTLARDWSNSTADAAGGNASRNVDAQQRTRLSETEEPLDEIDDGGNDFEIDDGEDERKEDNANPPTTAAGKMNEMQFHEIGLCRQQYEEGVRFVSLLEENLKDAKQMSELSEATKALVQTSEKNLTIWKQKVKDNKVHLLLLNQCVCEKKEIQ